MVVCSCLRQDRPRTRLNCLREMKGRICKRMALKRTLEMEHRRAIGLVGDICRITTLKDRSNIIGKYNEMAQDFNNLGPMVSIPIALDVSRELKMK